MGLSDIRCLAERTTHAGVVLFLEGEVKDKVSHPPQNGRKEPAHAGKEKIGASAIFFSRFA